MDFSDQLIAAVREKQTPVLVGIDPRPEELPQGYLERFSKDRAGIAQALQTFGCEIVDLVASRVPAVKFQSAFYEAYGPEGVAALHATVEHAKDLGLIVIFDGKRNDIGSTAEAYARAYLGRVPVSESYEPSWRADAMTVNPYLGSDGVVPFAKIAAREHKGVFVLVRTSNQSAREFQDLVTNGKPLYVHVAEKLLVWNGNRQGDAGYGHVGAVVGATYPEELAQLRAMLPGILFLVPGYGTQGGTAESIAASFDDNGLGSIVNNSRGITFAYKTAANQVRFGSDWRKAVELALTEMIDDLAANTPAGKLRG